MIEYNRLLAWGEAVGLINLAQGSHVATTLGTNAVELCSIISRIGWLLGEFRSTSEKRVVVGSEERTFDTSSNRDYEWPVKPLPEKSYSH